MSTSIYTCIHTYMCMHVCKHVCIGDYNPSPSLSLSLLPGRGPLPCGEESGQRYEADRKNERNGGRKERTNNRLKPLPSLSCPVYRILDLLCSSTLPCLARPAPFVIVRCFCSCPFHPLAFLFLLLFLLFCHLGGGDGGGRRRWRRWRWPKNEIVVFLHLSLKSTIQKASIPT